FHIYLYLIFLLNHSPLLYHDIRYALVFLVSAFSFALEEQTYSFDLYAVVYFYLLVYVSFVLSYLGDFAAFSPVQYFGHCVVANSFSVVYLLNAALVLMIDSGFDYLIFLSIFLLALWKCAPIVSVDSIVVVLLFVFTVVRHIRMIASSSDVHPRVYL